jgi:hypothetical protein
MTETALFTLLISIISAGLVSRGFVGVTVAQAFQPTQQGVPTGPSVHLFRLSDTPLGHVRRDSVWDIPTSLMTDTELQTMLSTFQVSALVTPNPADINALTAAALVRAVRQVMQSSATIAQLRTNGAAVYRVATIRNPSFRDDRRRNEFSPNFDFTISYDEISMAEAAPVETIELNINRV